MRIRRYSLAVVSFLLVVGIWPAKAELAGDEHLDSRHVRVPSRALLDLPGLGIRPLQEQHYGSFVWLELGPADHARLKTAGVSFEEHPNAVRLRLGGLEFDPRRGEPGLPPGWNHVRRNDADFHLVQFHGPARGEWLARLEQSGLRIVQYVSARTYVVWGDADTVKREARFGHVRWTGPFANGYRVLPRWRNLGDAPIDVDVLLYRGTDPDRAVVGMEQLGGIVRGRTILNDTFETVGMTLAGSELQTASRIPGVYTIQAVATDGGLRGELSNQIAADNFDQVGQAVPGYQEWLAGIGLNGSGVIVATVDAGMQENHPDLVNRVVECSGVTCAGSAANPHGTHVAGIIAADGASGTVDGAGFLRGLGMAPGAGLVEQDFQNFFTQPTGMLLLMSESHRNGASLSSNSWGPAATPRGYDSDTLQVDIGVRDADPDAPGNQPLTYVLAIMNGEGGTSSQGSPDEAKNIFAIGATRAQRTDGTQDPNLDDLSHMSAHGPALDGRIIPHMVAPGCSVDSTGTGGGHYLSCGTSMAAPHVAGAVALFIEYYRNLPNTSGDPSPALIKAAFLAVAHDLAGHFDADVAVLGHPYDSKQGWGRLNVAGVVDPQLNVLYFDSPFVFDETGQEWAVQLSPEDPDTPMRFMLVWTDAPGHGLGGSTPAWNNDLDLVVETDQVFYRGNNFGANGWSGPGGVADGMNNTEGIFLDPAALPDRVTVRVIAGDINSDGIPGEGDSTDQDFALVCYNCSEEPGFRLSAVPERQDVCVSDDAVFNVDVGQILGYATPVTLDATGTPSGTSVSFSVNPVTPPGTSELRITDTGAAAPGSYVIDIEGVAPDLIRTTGVTLNLYDVAPDPVVPAYPSNGVGNVVLLPTLRWGTATGALSYEVEVSTDSAFENLVETAGGLPDPNYALVDSLVAYTKYYWRARASNICGPGDYSPTYSFTTLDRPAILLVDDDDDSPDVRSYYTSALEVLGQAFDVRDTATDNEPDAATLAAYRMVIWFTGGASSWATTGPSAASESALGSFLDNGNGLFISSQDYEFGRGRTPFMSDYLGVGLITDFAGHTEITGAGSLFGGLGTYPLSYPATLNNYTDTVEPDASAELAFMGQATGAAVNKDSGVYRTVFWGFPLAAIAEADARVELLNAVVRWCTPPFLADCNRNGVPDVDDLAQGTSKDCNGNEVPDECDIADGTCTDVNGDGVPDECLSPALPEPGGVRKNRYISFVPNNDGQVAFQIEMTRRACAYTGRECVTDSDCMTCTGTGYACKRDSQCPDEKTCEISGESCDQADPPVVLGWVGAPFDPGCENEDGSSKEPPEPCAGEKISRSVANPVAREWVEQVVYVGDCEIVPARTYSVRASVDGGVTLSAALDVGTTPEPLPKKRGDLVGVFSGSWSGPDGNVSLNDVMAALMGFAQHSDAPHTTWIDVHGEVPDFVIDVDDLEWILQGFHGKPYPFRDPVNCP